MRCRADHNSVTTSCACRGCVVSAYRWARRRRSELRVARRSAEARRAEAITNALLLAKEHARITRRRQEWV